jgi:hypothetical protein
MRRAYIVILVGLLVASIAGLGYLVAKELAEFEYGEGVARVDWLPAEARNVSFFRSYSWTAYEFDISEAAFKKWASDWDVAELTSPQTVARYGFGYDQWMNIQSADDDMEAQRRTELRWYTRISRGLYYRHEQSNGGGVTVGYDRDAGRAYFKSSPR